MSDEEWKEIKGYPNYMISSCGNLYNNSSGRYLHPTLTKNGYLVITLYKNKMKKQIFVHRLVAMAFLTNPLNKSDVDHINNNRTDNNLSNLRFATKSENGINRKVSPKNRNGVKGVYFCKRDKRYLAHITIDGIQIHIGSYQTLEEAKQARIKRVNEVFGEFTNACEKII